jgi:hypothetical protein
MAEIRALLGGVRCTYTGDLGIRWEKGLLTVSFRNSRQQMIRYRLQQGFFTFRSRVARAAVVDKIGRNRLAREILLRNRAVDVVAFRFDERGGIEGVIEQPAASLQRDELLYYIATLARECDRLEYILTGRDRH